MGELWSGWVRMRNDIDVTADDTAIDGSNSGYQFTDFTRTRGSDSTKGGVTDLPPEPCTVMVGFYSEGIDNSMSFGCELWAANPGGPVQKVCDVTGKQGGGWADFTSADSSVRLFIEDLTVADDSLWGDDVTTGNLLKDGMGWVSFCSKGFTTLFPRFYNVGDTTETKRIKALLRAY